MSDAFWIVLEGILSYTLLGMFVVFSPVWVPFWLVGYVVVKVYEKWLR